MHRDTADPVDQRHLLRVEHGLLILRVTPVPSTCSGEIRRVLGPRRSHA